MTPGRILFQRHNRTQKQHPCQTSGTHQKHQQHQRPATPHAEEPVFHSDSQCLGRFIAARHRRHEEGQRRAALVEASILKRRKLIEARDGQNDCATDAGRLGRPRPARNSRHARASSLIEVKRHTGANSLDSRSSTADQPSRGGAVANDAAKQQNHREGGWAASSRLSSLSSP